VIAVVLVLAALVVAEALGLVREDVARREWKSDALHARRLLGRPHVSLPHETVIDPLRRVP
jgi:hypothetical protein